MSGRKQHYIPQALLRGFGIPRKGKTKKVLVYKRGQPSYVSSTKDVAAQRHFYSELSKDGSKTLDDEITSYETKLARLLKLLREAPLDDSVDGDIAAELITHLTVRGAHLRDVFGFAGKEMITEFANILGNEDQMRALMGIDGNEPTSILKEEIERFVTEQSEYLAQTGLPKPLVIQVSGAGESHPRALPEPDVSLSTHPAPIIQPCLN